MINMQKFQGTGVALITPFRADKSVDFQALERIIEHVIINKSEYIVMMGTTSEAPTLVTDEKSAVINHIIEITNKRVPLVLGIGGNNTMEIVKTIKETDFSNIDGILSVVPYYNKPTQDGIYEHFKEISRVSPVPIILYNVPARTSVNMSAETCLKLATNFSNIVAVKEASGNMSQIMQIIKNKPAHFSVLSGDDALAYPMISLGASGVISVVANATPAEFTEMIRLAIKNDSKALKLHYKYLDFIDSLFLEGNPAGVKVAMNELGLCKNFVRLPLVSVSKNTNHKIVELLKKL